MSDWAARAGRIIERIETRDVGEDDATLEHFALVNERLDFEGLRGMVWCAMPYRCGDCGAVEWYECEVGVEGPAYWRDDRTFIASSFGGGPCGNCRGDTTHVIGRDWVFNPREPGTDIEEMYTTRVGGPHFQRWPTRMFRVTTEPVRYPTEGCYADGRVIYATGASAFLSTPMHAINRRVGISD